MMLRILLSTEFGGGSGHLGTLAPLASEWVAAGFTVEFALRDQHDSVRIFLQGAKVHHVPPLARLGARFTRAPISYPELLLEQGFHSPAALELEILRWLSVLEKGRPDLLIVDYAPCAALAAKVLGILTINVGVGFVCPPDRSPMPSFRRDDIAEADAAALSERLVQRSIKHVVTRWRLPYIRTVADALRPAATFLTVWGEADPYAESRQSEVYVGPIYPQLMNSQRGRARSAKMRAFVYLRPDQSDTYVSIIATLTSLNCEVDAYIPRLRGEAFQKLHRMGVEIFDNLIDLDTAVQAADFVVCNGVITALAALQGSKPVILLPMQIEQMVTANRLVARKLGIGLRPAMPVDAIRSQLSAYLADLSNYTARAEVFAAKYPATRAERVQVAAQQMQHVFQRATS